MDDGLRRGEKEGGWGTWLSCQASGTIIMMVSGRVRVEALTRVSRQESKLPESDFLSLAIGKSCGWVGGWEEEV